MMKQTRAIFLTVILTLIAFGTVLYTSCRKDYCKGMLCQHGGVCNDGACTCPQGYTGTFCQTPNVSNISFNNETFTPVFITVNNVEYTIDTGKMLTFTGSHGDTLKGFARTHGNYGINVDIPSFKIVFPVRGNLIHDLDVAAEYFFLMATNKNPTVPYITQVRVIDRELGDSTLDITVINNTGKPHHIGYYRASVKTKVRLEKTPNYWMFDTLPLPMTKNQYFDAVVN